MRGPLSHPPLPTFKRNDMFLKKAFSAFFKDNNFSIIRQSDLVALLYGQLLVFFYEHSLTLFVLCGTTSTHLVLPDPAYRKLKKVVCCLLPVFVAMCWYLDKIFIVSVMYFILFYGVNFEIKNSIYHRDNPVVGSLIKFLDL